MSFNLKEFVAIVFGASIGIMGTRMAIESFRRKP